MAWAISAMLYTFGALNMAVCVADHHNFLSGRTVFLCALWPFITVLAVVEAIFDVEFW